MTHEKHAPGFLTGNPPYEPDPTTVVGPVIGAPKTPPLAAEDNSGSSATDEPAVHRTGLQGVRRPSGELIPSTLRGTDVPTIEAWRAAWSELSDAVRRAVLERVGYRLDRNVRGGDEFELLRFDGVGRSEPSPLSAADREDAGGVRPGTPVYYDTEAGEFLPWPGGQPSPLEAADREDPPYGARPFAP